MDSSRQDININTTTRGITEHVKIKCVLEGCSLSRGDII